MGRTSFVGRIVFAAIAASASAFSADNPNPGVVLPHGTVAGKTLGEWSGLWWQWAFGNPSDLDPLQDTTGKLAGIAQQGPVFFLYGTWGGMPPFTRACPVPCGKYLFFPLYNTICWAGPPDKSDCDPGNFPVCVECAKVNIDACNTLTVTIDGTDLDVLFRYRETSPVFDFRVPAVSFVHLDPAYTWQGVSDGYWLMLTPLQRGEHTIRIVVSAPGLADFEVVTHLTVE